MQKYMDVVLTTDGSPIGGASVYVTNLSGTVPVIYSDDGVTVAANPLTTNSLGAFSFYAADGRYTLSISVGGYPVTTISDILLDDPTNASANVVVGGSVDNSPIGASTPSSGRFTTLAASGNATLGDAEATDTHAINGATTVLANSASPALKVTQTGSGNAFVVEDAASDATPFVIDASGKVIVGHTAAIAGGYGDSALLYELGALPRHFLQAYGADVYAPVVEFAKSRNAVIGSHTVVQAMDELGSMRFSGSDGTAYKEAASIRAFVDGTPGTNDMPGRLVFGTTADGASVPTERMRIDSSGNVGIGATSPGHKVDIQAALASTQLKSTTGTNYVAHFLSNSGGYVYLGAESSAGGTLFNGTAAYAAVFGATSANPVALCTNNTERMRIDSSGNVGIGAAPTYDLDISKTKTGAALVSRVYNAGTGAGSEASLRVVQGVVSGTISAQGDSVLYIGASSNHTVVLLQNSVEVLRIGTTKEVLVTNPSGLGYGTGAGGTVTQATSRTTGVTLNKPTGAITLVSAAGSTSWQSFTVTNSLVAATDVVRVSQKSGTDKYMMHVTNVAAGSFQITFATTGGTTTEQPVFNFALIKGATS